MMMRMMGESAKEVAIMAIRECGKQYNFDAECAIRELGLESVKAVLSKSKSAVKPNPSSGKSTEGKIATMKTAFPLPYNGEYCEENCQALRQNNGLYTQCQYKKENGNDYCKGCQKLAEKSDNGIPEYGRITDRTAVDIFDYVDPKGRSPIAYTKIMKKYKLTEEMVMEEAGKHGITVDSQHFASEGKDVSKRGRPSSGKEKVVKEKGAKGRPKKEKKTLEIEGDADDLFASLVAEMNINDDEEVEVEEVVVAKKGKSEEEKEAERLAKEEAKAAKKAAEEEAKKEKEEKAAMLAEEKAAKASKAAEEKAAKEAKLAEEKAAKAAKTAEEKAAKEAKLAEEKAAKAAKAAEEKAAKEAKKAAEEEAKASKKKSDEPKKSKQVAKEATKEATKEAEETDEEEQPDVVKKIEIDGKKYLKSKNTGIIYDYTEYVKNGDQVVVGKWNDAKNQIDFTQSSEEEDDEEYVE